MEDIRNQEMYDKVCQELWDYERRPDISNKFEDLYHTMLEVKEYFETVLYPYTCIKIYN